MLNLHWLDVLIVGSYFAFVLVLGFALLRTKTVKSSADYLLAGRTLTLPAFVATTVSTWYGGILGVGEYSYRHGLVNWVVFGVPYYLAILVFALFLAETARTARLTTIPEQLERHYGKTASLIGALFLFVTTVPAAYVLMLAILLQALFGWQLPVCLIAGTVFSTCYILRGGFRSVVRTDLFQFVLMFAAFLMLVPFALVNYGGLNFLREHLPEEHLTWHGGLPVSAILVWFFIALATLVEPSLYQRCFAARDAKVAKAGLLLSMLCWIGFDALTTVSGLYARAIVPDLDRPVFAYLALADRLLPPVFLGIFLTGLLAIIMSTVDSYAFLAAVTLGRDFLGKLGGAFSEQRSVRLTRVALVATGILSVLIAYAQQSVVGIWKSLGSISAPVLLLPLLASFHPPSRPSPSAAVVAMTTSGVVATLWTLVPGSEGNAHLFGLEPIYPGLLSSALILLGAKVVARLHRRRRRG